MSYESWFIYNKLAKFLIEALSLMSVKSTFIQTHFCVCVCVYVLMYMFDKYPKGSTNNSVYDTFNLFTYFLAS